ncbi:MAG: hypothetical protein EXS15_02035 [Phycisphaerales bacterium]|nr:hypothetical protein [Phycisphaerales bacterium]
MKHPSNWRSTACAIVALAVVSSFATAQATKPAATKPAATKPAATGSATAGATGDAAPSKKQVFVLPLDGMVGVGLRHEEMEEVEKVADKFGPGQVIVLRINSNGGLVIEGDKISDSLMRIKNKHRLVAWIEKAISGGAFAALHADEMYFMPEAALGSITMLSGRTEVTEVREDWKERVAQVCAMGGRDPLIGPAMVHSEVELSYDKVGDKVTFYPDVKHEFILSRADENLDFSAKSAEHCGFSEGTASTEAELFAALGVDNKERFQENDAGKKIAAKWQKLIKGAHDEVPLLLQKRGIEGSSEGGIPFLQARIRNTQKIIDWFKKARPVMLYELNVPEQAIEQLEAEIVDMRKRIKELQAAPTP